MEFGEYFSSGRVNEEVRKRPMQAVRTITICLLCAYLVVAQESAARPPHGLLVLKLSWSKETIYSLPITSSQPSGENSLPRENSNGTVSAPSGAIGNAGRLALPQVLYTYSMKVKNVGAKTILGVFWEYVTTDSVSGAELGRRQIINYQKVKPDAVVNLSARRSLPPTILVTVKRSENDALSTLLERADIRCVLYADSTVWQPADSSGAGCEELRRVLKQMEAERSRRR